MTEVNSKFIQRKNKFCRLIPQFSVFVATVDTQILNENCESKN